jgi:tripartite-type tricarboxylate transporter receptor subunit TctC
MKKLLSASLRAGATLPGAATRHASAYPAKTVRLVVPYAPGGAHALAYRESRGRQVRTTVTQ